MWETFAQRKLSQFLHVCYLTFISQKLVPNLFLLDGILFSEESKMSQGCEKLQEIMGRKKKEVQVEQKEKQQIKKDKKHNQEMNEKDNRKREKLKQKQEGNKKIDTKRIEQKQR